MRALEHFLSRGIQLKLVADKNIGVLGNLNDSLREAIKSQKLQIIDELRWQEFESLLAIVAPAYKTTAYELDVIRITARTDLSAAICAYRAMARRIKPIVRIGDEKHS